MRQRHRPAGQLLPGSRGPTRIRDLLPSVLLLGVLTVPARASVPAEGFQEATVVGGLSQPTALAFLPDGRFLVTQQGGQLLLVSGGSATLLTTLPVCFADITPVLEVETGLLGVAVHPNFPADRSIFLYRTRTGGPEPCDDTDLYAGQMVNEVVRATLGSGDTVELGGLQVLLTGIRAATGYHNGGALRIGPDDKLYVGVGDSGLGDDGGPPGTSTNPYAQDLGALEGKILRLNLDGTPAGDNPFVGQGGARPEVWALGFRNPFRMSFDPETDSLWAGDVGEDTLEEIDRVTAGANHGWPRCEGTLPAGCQQPGDVPPVFEYPHQGPGALGDSVIGGVFPVGGALAALAGHYVFADFEDDPPFGDISALTLDATRTGVSGTPSTVVADADGPVDLVIGPDGALYYVAYLAGAVRRVAGTGAAACTTIPTCQAALDAVLPDPTVAPDRAHRKVARKLRGLDGKSDKRLARAAEVTGAQQARLYRKAEGILQRLLAAARRADTRGRLDVTLPTLEAAVGALLGTIPTG